MATRTWLWLGLAACVATGAVVWVQRPAPCAMPVAYRLGQIDERFGVTRPEVLEALRQAEALWERALGRELFVHDPAAQLTVNLVYDERQQTTQAGERLRHSMRETRTSHAAIGESYAHWRRTYDSRAQAYREAQASYQERVQAFNATVQQWNSRGGAPGEVQAQLEAERRALEARRQELETDRSALEDLAATVRALADRGNAAALAHNRDATTFNGLYGERRTFHKGEFDGREIVVFEFRDLRDFTLVLAHELGHARGLGHVEDPAAVMNAIGGGQVVEPLSLSATDIAAITGLCRGR